MNPMNEQHVPPSYAAYPHPVQPAPANDDLSLLDLWDIFTGQMVLIGFVAILTVAAAVAIAVNMETRYRATVLFAPAGSGEMSSGGGFKGSRIGQLASLAGVSVGGGNEVVKSQLAILTSRVFITKFVDELNVKPDLFYEQWDAENQKWLPPKAPSIDKQIKAYIKGLLMPAENMVPRPNSDSHEPTDWITYDVFTSLLTVIEDEESGLITVSIEWRDPVKAAEWANALVKRINRHVKDTKVSEAEKSIQYLENELKNTTLVDMREVLYSLIESQVKTIVLSKVRDEFAFTVIDPAVVPESASRPKRGLIVSMGLVLGLLLGMMVALARHFRNYQKKRSAESPTPEPKPEQEPIEA